jgi:hypothetical protein
MGRLVDRSIKVVMVARNKAIDHAKFCATTWVRDKASAGINSHTIRPVSEARFMIWNKAYETKVESNGK